MQANQGFDPSGTPTSGPKLPDYMQSLHAAGEDNKRRIANLKAGLAALPDEGPSSRHPFDVNPGAAYKAATRLLALRLRNRQLGHLPPHTPGLRLPQPYLKPPAVS